MQKASCWPSCRPLDLVEGALLRFIDGKGVEGRRKCLAVDMSIAKRSAEACHTNPTSTRESTVDVGVILNPLTDHADILGVVMPFASDQGYLFVAGVSKRWRMAWGDRPENTRMESALRSVSCVAWAKDSGCRWDKWICWQVAKGGSLEVMQWCRANGCPWDEWACMKAAEGVTSKC